MEKIRQVIKDWFTARNGVDYSGSKIIGYIAFVIASVKFYESATPDYVGYAAVTTGLITALAAKYFVEGEPSA